MRGLKNVLAHAASSGVLVAGCAGSALLARAQQVNSETPPAVAAVARWQSEENRTAVNNLPDSPGATLAQAQTASLPQAPAQSAPDQATPNQGSTNQPSTNQAPASQAAPDQASPQRPVGTAAAEAPGASGVAASEPAGAAIAPAKQRRARTIIIKTGAIIGAAVAVGIVVALTEATGSKPPGAH
jgi:hypothetical protein